MVFGIFGKKVRPWILHLLVAACLVAFSARSIKAQQVSQQTKAYFIERIEIVGTRRVPTPWGLIHSRAGAAYSDEAVERDVQALRDSGFFFDVKVDVLDSPSNQNGKIVAFSFREKPIIKRIVYKGLKSMPESDIASAFVHEKVGLSVGAWFDQNELAHGAVVIKDLLAARGCTSSTVKQTSETNFSANVVTVHFEVNKGPKSP